MCLGTIGRVSRVWDEGGVPMGMVVTGATESPACLLYVPEATPGQQVLVHSGFVVEVLDPQRASEAVALRVWMEESRPGPFSP